MHTLGFRVLKALVLCSVLGFFCSEMVSALSYQQDIGVNFTFNKVLSLTLSSNDIHITNLAPGTASDSNIININVLTNSVAGYALTATVGNSTYNTRNLKHSNSNISDVFSSIDYTSTPTITSNSSLGTDKWGFSFSLDNGNSWSNYNGLPLYFGDTKPALLKQTNGPVSSTSGDNIKFKIGAKASSSKPAGDYSNIINFYVVAYPAPATLFDAFEAAGAEQLYGYYQMQDMTSSICSAVEADESELQVIDNRDNKVYWIAKLADGNCWMTQNLDHNIRTDTNFYTYANTDIGHGSTPNTSATWTASALTHSSNDNEWDTTTVGYTTLESYDAGEYCFNPNSGAIESGCTDYHYHVGNYYNFSAAVAMNTTLNSAVTYDQSICPAGWKLPSTSNYLNLIDGVYTAGQSGNIHLAPVYFVYGSAYAGMMGGLASGEYATPRATAQNTYILHFDSYGNLWYDYAPTINRGSGISVRCIAR